MKFLNWILTLITIGLILIIGIMLGKSTSGRFQFKEVKAEVPGPWFEQRNGYVILDTATGKIYQWISYLASEDAKIPLQRIITIDPIKNRATSYIQNTPQE